MDLRLLPLVFGDVDLFEGALETAVLGAAGVDSNLEGVCCGVEVGDSQLAPVTTVVGVLQKEVAAATADAVPHVLDVGGDFGCGPVGVAEVGYYGSQLTDLGINILG